MLATVLLDLLSPAIAVVIAVWGFRKSSQADRLRAFFDLHERYLAPEVRTGRRLIHEVVAGRTVDEIDALPRDQRDTVGHTLAVLNSIAIASEGGYVDQALIVDSMARSFSGTVAAARPYIDAIEKRRGFRPYPFAERLAAKLAAAGPP